MIDVPEYLTEIHGETTLEQITYYARACIADPKHNNRKHIWACQRLLDDLQRSEDAACPFYWDENEAQNIVEWFSLLRGPAYHSHPLAALPAVPALWMAPEGERAETVQEELYTGRQEERQVAGRGRRCFV